MTQFFLGVILALSALVFVYLFRVSKGPTSYDRVIGLNGIANKAVVLIILIGLLYKRPDMFLDISLGYAFLNWVSSLAVAKYLEKQGHEG